MNDSVVHLRADGTSLALDVSQGRLPTVLHWGPDLGDLTEAELRAAANAGVPQRATNTLDVPVPVALLPEASAGWPGTPGLTAHRDGRHFSTAFTVTEVHHGTTADTQVVRVQADDDEVGVTLLLEVEMAPGGLVRTRAALTNDRDGTLTVDGLLLGLTLPSDARELLDLTGRHLRERTPQRHAFTHGTHVRENRRGRTGTDASLLTVAGETGFGFRHGRVWGVHVGWSGNHRELAEATPEGVRLLGGGELLLPGEVRLDARRGLHLPVGLRGVRRGPGRPGRPLPPLRAGPTEPPAHAAPGDVEHLGGGLLRPRPGPAGGAGRARRAGRRGAVRARRRVVPWPAQRRAPAWVTGTSTRRSGPMACARWSTRSTSSAWSSACGSSRRWSTPTPTWPASTPTGC